MVNRCGHAQLELVRSAVARPAAPALTLRPQKWEDLSCWSISQAAGIVGAFAKSIIIWFSDWKLACMHAKNIWTKNCTVSEEGDLWGSLFRDRFSKCFHLFKVAENVLNCALNSNPLSKRKNDHSSRGFAKRYSGIPTLNQRITGWNSSQWYSHMCGHPMNGGKKIPMNGRNRYIYIYNTVYHFYDNPEYRSLSGVWMVHRITSGAGGVTAYSQPTAALLSKHFALEFVPLVGSTRSSQLVHFNIPQDRDQEWRPMVWEPSFLFSDSTWQWLTTKHLDNHLVEFVYHDQPGRWKRGNWY